MTVLKQSMRNIGVGERMNKYLNMSKTKEAFKRFGFGQEDESFRRKFKRAAEQAQGRYIEVDGYGDAKVVE